MTPDCIYQGECERYRIARLILNFTALKYRTVAEVMEMLRQRGMASNAMTVRTALETMVKERVLHRTVVESKNRGPSPVGYRNRAMWEKAGGGE